MENKVSSKLLNKLVMIGIILTILALVGAPFVIGALLKITNNLNVFPNIILILVASTYVCAVPYVIGLFKLKSICKILTEDNCFSMKIVKEFKTIAICAFSEAVIFVVVELILSFGCKFYLYAATIIPVIIIPFVSLVIGFISLVMSNIFKKAAEIKKENDLTF